MRISVDKLKSVVTLNNSIIGNNSLRKAGPLSNLIFIIRDRQLYTISQGQKNMSAMALLYKLGETDEPAGVYAIDGQKMNRTLAECEGDIDINFISDDTRHEVVVVTEFGEIKFGTYTVESATADTNFEVIIPTLLELEAETKTEGHKIEQEVWDRNLSIVTATREEDLMPNPFLVHEDLVGISLPYMTLRYKTELPYHFATELDIVRVLREVVLSGEEDTYSQVTNKHSRNQFHFVTGDIYYYVNGVNTANTVVTTFPWEQDPAYTGSVHKEQLQKLIRLSNIFAESDQDIVIDWDFGGKKVAVYNSSANHANQSGINTHANFTHNHDGEYTVKTGVHGPTVLKLLTYTNDEYVNVEMVPSKKYLHVTFTEGDFYVFYKAL